MSAASSSSSIGHFRAALDRRAHAAGMDIPATVAAKLYQYVDLLSRWNLRINLTSLPLDRPTDETLDRLLIEPLAVAAGLEVSPLTWVDLGSGGGSPAIPMKLMRPAFRLTMVESKVKKAAFLREAIRVLELDSARVENARFESLLERLEFKGSLDLVTVRAVRVDELLLHLCRHILKERGKLVLFGFKGDELDGFRRTGMFHVKQS